MPSNAASREARAGRAVVRQDIAHGDGRARHSRVSHLHGDRAVEGRTVQAPSGRGRERIELSEDEFRQQSHLNDPALLEKRQSSKQPGDFALVFGDVVMAGGDRIFLAAKIMVALPAERLQRLRAMFSAPAVHFRLRQGGAAILNLKNLVRVTFNPGPDRAPSGAWPAHHLSRRQGSRRIAEAMTGTKSDVLQMAEPH